MSAVGTIPDNEDKRPPDIIADRQIHRAATDPGTFAETPRPPLPQLPIVVPPNIEDFVRDVAVSTFKDLAKTITINGQTPEVTSQSVAFELPVTPPASAQFAQMNPPPATPPPPAPPAPAPPTGGITTLQEMEASSAARNAPRTIRERNEEAMDERMARRLQADPNYRPSALASNEERESFNRVTNQTANPQGFQPTPVTPQLQQQLIGSVTPGATGMNWLQVDRRDATQWDASANRPVFGRQENRLPDESRSEQVTREQSEYNRQRRELRDSTAALREERPGQRAGEGVRSYTERTNEARLDAMNKEQAAAVKNGDSSYFYKGFIPILFTRKDGQRKILARLDNTHSVVIEGAAGNERQGSLPPENGYYEAGAGLSLLHPFQIRQKTEGEPPVTQVLIEASSDLYTELGSFSNQAITGLDFWTNIQDGFVILKGTYVDGELDEAEILWGEASRGTAVEFSGDLQSSFRYCIGYIYEDDDVWFIRQECFGNLSLVETCINGKPAQYPISI